MKKALFAVALILCLKSYSQTDTAKVVQYCEIVATGKLFSRKVTIEIDFGEFKSVWKDNRLKDEATGEFKSFNTVTDALNYMGRKGWKLVNAFPINSGSGPAVYHFFFKKEVMLSELGTD